MYRRFSTTRYACVPVLIVVLVVGYVSAREAVEMTPEAANDSAASEQLLADLDYDNFDNPTVIDNEWYPLQPGTYWVYEGITVEGGQSIPHRIEYIVTDLTKEIEGIRTVVLWIVDYRDEEVVEKEIAFYSQDNDGTIWYFGEYPEEYENGEFVAAPTWIAGLQGAKAGIKMLADPQLGTPSYAQGLGPEVGWADLARVVAMGQATCVPVNCYEDVLVIAETGTGEAGAFQFKYYARGIGEVRVGWRGADTSQEELELVKYEQLSPEAMEDIRIQALELEAHAYEISEDVYTHTSRSEYTPLAE
jgi:hypothetical protein